MASLYPYQQIVIKGSEFIENALKVVEVGSYMRQGKNTVLFTNKEAWTAFYGEIKRLRNDRQPATGAKSQGIPTNVGE